MLYMGSKARIRNDILDVLYMAREVLGIDRYYELFIGGCNIIGYVDFAEKYGSDLNKYLVAFIEELKQNGIKNIPPRITRDEWYRVKDAKDVVDDWYHFYCMNFWSFRGRHYGGFNQVDYDGGLNRAAIIESELSKLTSFDIECKAYDEVNIKPHSIIYLDPPYKGTKDYSRGVGEKFDHEKFYKYAQELAKNNFVLISEYMMPRQFKPIKNIEIRSFELSSPNVIERLYVVRGGYGVDAVLDALNSNDTSII